MMIERNFLPLARRSGVVLPRLELSFTSTSTRRRRKNSRANMAPGWCRHHKARNAPEVSTEWFVSRAKSPENSEPLKGGASETVDSRVFPDMGGAGGNEPVWGLMPAVRSRRNVQAVLAYFESSTAAGASRRSALVSCSACEVPCLPGCSNETFLAFGCSEG
jgi:hypothetical protein